MKPASEITAIVIDHGLFLPLAERLAREYSRVLYFSEWREGFSIVNKAVVGDGIPGVERVKDFWEVKDECDVWIFPDLHYSGLQLELESQGEAVWGARSGDSLELDRELFMRTIHELELDAPKFDVLRGITELRDHLRDCENKFVKISHYRGSMETFHWRSWALDSNFLDVLAVRFGGVRDLIKFLVFDAIETDLEIGGDAYCVDGRCPAQTIQGVEWKDKAYFGAVTPTEQMPEQIKHVMDAFKPVLSRYHYRNFWSMEVRVLDDKAYFIDPTCRMGLPSGASQMELWSNLGEIIWAGANGELVEPETAGKFSAEIVLKVKGDKTQWRPVEIPKHLRQWLKFSGHCEVDGLAWFSPDDADNACGWLVAIGDTPQETLDTLKDYVADLPDGLDGDIAPIAKVIAEIDIAHGEGVKFTSKPMPTPAEAVEA